MFSTGFLGKRREVSKGDGFEPLVNSQVGICKSLNPSLMLPLGMYIWLQRIRMKIFLLGDVFYRTCSWKPEEDTSTQGTPTANKTQEDNWEEGEGWVPHHTFLTRQSDSTTIHGECQSGKHQLCEDLEEELWLNKAKLHIALGQKYWIFWLYQRN